MSLLAILLVAASGLTVPQEAPEPAKAEDPQARAAWQAFLDATRPPGSTGAPPAPITAFRLEATALTRMGVQTNEVRVDYRYLEPDCIRFLLPTSKEVGRFSAKQRDYWLRDRDEVVVLTGRDHAEDRRQIDEMFSIAKNFVALSDPARLTITSMELLAAPPADVSSKLQNDSRKLTWLRVTTPDFALLRGDGTQAAEGTIYAVDLALQPAGDARFVIVREQTVAGQPPAEPMFIRLDRFSDQNGFRIPLQFYVYRLDRDLRPVVFAEKASQEIFVTKADLRAKLSVDDFKP